ncbi:LXG domain of WXG superfamily protein [Streptococcus equinus]|uniref:LXG domain of WXG superfamily protein n=1 Tax=Streptococcus equinus TaxID=1335 RepID=A0A1H0Q8Z8_STREI|nr:glycohydrolase toxin TNT-related protein [Streptococcus equinus]SDP13186.1 LXG domain of WXG superfamily protein [Streptococcus equinus]
MGFHVSLDELNKAADKLGQEAGKLESQLDTAKNSVNKIITSEALTGKTGQAIYHQLNNVDAAIIVGLEDTTKLLASDLYSLISEFQSSVGESSATAVLDEDYLNQLKDNLNNFKNQHGEQETNISGIYSSISDLISLSGPTSTYDADSDAASQLLTNTIDKVTSFDSAGSELSSESMLTAIDSKVNQVSQVVDLPYSDSQYLSFVNDADFAKGINTVDKQIKEQEKLAKEEAEKEAKKQWAKQHPIEALLQFTTEETTNFFEWANQEVLGSNLLPTEKIEMSLALGFASKACETVGDLAIGAVQIINLEQEALLDLENKYVLHRETPQWIKDDLTGTCDNVQAVIGLAGDLIKRDPKAWKAVYKGIEDSASEVIHNIATGNTFEISGYVFDVATLVGPAAVGKLKYAEEAGNLAKLAEAGDVASTVGKVEDGVKVGKALSFEKLMSAEDAQKYVQWNKYAEAGIEPEGRIKLTDWLYAPEDNFYLSHKNIYDNPDFVNQLTGEFIYPGTPESALGKIDGSVHVDGFLNGRFDNITLQPGTIIDRYGSNSNGRYFSPIGTNFENRALPPFMINEPYRKYIILKPINSKAGIIAPWFNQPGMGIQYYTELSVKDLIDRNYIRILK